MSKLKTYGFFWSPWSAKVRTAARRRVRNEKFTKARDTFFFRLWSQISASISFHLCVKLLSDSEISWTNTRATSSSQAVSEEVLDRLSELNRDMGSVSTARRQKHACAPRNHKKPIPVKMKHLVEWIRIVGEVRALTLLTLGILRFESWPRPKSLSLHDFISLCIWEFEDARLTQIMDNLKILQGLVLRLELKLVSFCWVQWAVASGTLIGHAAKWIHRFLLERLFRKKEDCPNRVMRDMSIATANCGNMLYFHINI